MRQNQTHIVSLARRPYTPEESVNKKNFFKEISPLH